MIRTCIILYRERLHVMPLHTQCYDLWLCPSLGPTSKIYGIGLVTDTPLTDD